MILVVLFRNLNYVQYTPVPARRTGKTSKLNTMITIHTPNQPDFSLIKMWFLGNCTEFKVISIDEVNFKIELEKTGENDLFHVENELSQLLLTEQYSIE